MKASFVKRILSILMSQPFFSALLMFAAACLVGCEHFVHEYDCRGTVLKADGSPAGCVVVHMDTAGPPRDAWWDGDILHTAVTDPDGHFRAFCVGDIYTQWALCPTPDAPKLPQIFLWFKTQRGWSALRVPLTDDQQSYRTAGGREVKLPPVTLP